MEQLARFLGVSCDKVQLEAMVESCNQLIEQCGNSEALSVCRGEVARVRGQTPRPVAAALGLRRLWESFRLIGKMGQN